MFHFHFLNEFLSHFFVLFFLFLPLFFIFSQSFCYFLMVIFNSCQFACSAIVQSALLLLFFITFTLTTLTIFVIFLATIISFKMQFFFLSLREFIDNDLICVSLRIFLGIRNLLQYLQTRLFWVLDILVRVEQIVCSFLSLLSKGGWVDLKTRLNFDFNITTILIILLV